MLVTFSWRRGPCCSSSGCVPACRFPPPCSLCWVPWCWPGFWGRTTASRGSCLSPGSLSWGERQKKLLFLGLWCGGFYLLWQPAAGLLAWLPAGLWTPRFRDFQLVTGYLLRNLLPQLGYALAAGLSLPLLARYSGARGAGRPLVLRPVLPSASADPLSTLPDFFLGEVSFPSSSGILEEEVK